MDGNEVGNKQGTPVAVADKEQGRHTVYLQHKS